MKRLTLIFLLSIILSQQLYATGQSSELIIYNGDTLPLLTEPLESYLQENEPRNQFYPFLEYGCSTALWRGYIGLWKLENNQLILLDIYPCGDKNGSILRKIFPKTNRIVADWFSGNLNIQHGKMIFYNHSGYNRCHEEETVVSIEQGKEKYRVHYINGIKAGDQGFSSNPDSIASEIYRRINWGKLSHLSKNKKLYIEVNMGEIDSLTIKGKQEGKQEGKYREELEKAITEFPQLKKFYWRGVPLQRSYHITIFFSRKNRRKYAR